MKKSIPGFLYIPTALLAWANLALFPLSAQAQFNIPGVSIPGLPQIKIPGTDSLFKQEEVITNSIKDVRDEVPYLDFYNPSELKPLTSLRRGPHGGWLLQPGLYGGDVRSYCLHAGTYGPTHGSGYLYAPLKGKRSGMIHTILHNSADHTELQQHDVQSLIWAIEASTKFSALPEDLQKVAALLLPAQDILELNGDSIEYLSDQMQEQALGQASSAMRPIYDAQNSLRGLLTQSNVPFDQLERVAVLTGNPPHDKNDREIPEGRWTLHPGGFFVRYVSSSYYSRTNIELYVPERFTIRRDAQGRILSVMDPHGNGVETDYDDKRMPLATTDQKVQGYSFASIRLIRTDAAVVSGKSVQEYKNAGWTFIGCPKDKNIQISNPVGYPECNVRLAAMITLLQQMDDFKRNYGKRKSAWGNPADLIDLASYFAAINSVFYNSSPPQSQFLDCLTNAWQWETCQWAFDPQDPTGPSADTEYDPSDDVAMLGENGRQRLGQSCVSYE